eukprot:scaffold97461_cov35-Attheya_sp.AAC.2
MADTFSLSHTPACDYPIIIAYLGVDAVIEGADRRECSLPGTGNKTAVRRAEEAFQVKARVKGSWLRARIVGKSVESSGSRAVGSFSISRGSFRFVSRQNANKKSHIAIPYCRQCT